VRLTQRAMRRIVHAIAFGRDPGARDAHTSEDGRAATAMRDEHAHWWDDRNVVGLCFAPKTRRGRVLDIGLQVHVRRKRARESVPAARRVPPWVRAESIGQRGKLWTDVREVGTARLDVLASAARPVHPGFNIGHAASGSGTLACPVRCRATGDRLGLSCAHVIARGGEAEAGERVLVPSLPEALGNGWLAESSFGALVATGRIRSGFDQAIRNVDAATVRPDDDAALDAAIALLAIVPSGVRAPVTLGTPVRKVGYATERTVGVVEAVSWVLCLPFERDDGTVQNVWFADHIGISHFASEGDSGALVIDGASAEAVGMHMGASGGLSVCAPMDRVLDGVGCDLA
jgi:hypothetical protein